MKRRQLLGQSAIAAGTAASLVACGKATTSNNQATTGGGLPNIRWRMVTSWPKSLDTLYGGAQDFCEAIAAMTGGKFRITPYAAGEIVPGLEVLDAVQNGTVECGHTASYYYIGKNPALGFACVMPFGLTAQQQNAWLYAGGGLEMMQKVYSDFNIINFPAGNTGAQMAGWFKKPVESLADLRGLKMRIPGLGGQVMAQLGVNVQVIPGGELFLALDRGTIDAAEWVGPYDDEKLGLNKAAKYYYYPGWWEPGPSLDVLVNQSQWAKLPQEYQTIFQEAARSANLLMLSRYETFNSIALKTLLDGGTILKSFSPEILTVAQETSQALLAEFASKDAQFKEIYQQWQTFRTQMFSWNAINELSYTKFVEKAP
ncbi:TRAP transporter substrate-binding protein [Synechocystis sp. PCC 7339]|uniref:TRAP transporter substrate-binding protein n=1 Tax=unclassified Synechocystis TaxID=2640012 RepID=UPI001BAE723D|nr:MULTISPECIES: TRAP transporter substrate-binding protein [unclassified Synechocystis]QUS61051.1 TRAP transporter substrate-binding protein [Synechocystis sp. PCC 7338]UAJ73234.1 TRAP transporter substrate-binding protein [Synechocystis sp. PCC 7339]